MSITLEDKTFFQCTCEDLMNDFLVEVVKNHWKNHFSDFDKFKFCDGLLYHDELLYIPEGLVQLQIPQVRHDTLVVGCFGFNKTMELVSCDYWWPQLWKFVKEFVGSCDVCVRVKNLCHHLHGFFQPLSILISPWSLIFMDFILDFLRSNSFDSILVVEDHLMKMAHFIPCNKSITG